MFTDRFYREVENMLYATNCVTNIDWLADGRIRVFSRCGEVVEMSGPARVLYGACRDYSRQLVRYVAK